MARYTCSYIVSLPFNEILRPLAELLEACNFLVEFYTETGDYVMAREMPGSVTFSKLVKVEVLIDRSTATESETRMNLVITNDELALQLDNHCRRIFEFIKQEIEQSRYIPVTECIPG